MGYSISLSLIPSARDQRRPDGLLSSLVGRQVDGVIWAIPEVQRQSCLVARWEPRPAGPGNPGREHGRPDLAPVDRDRQSGDRSSGDRASACRRRASDRHRHRSAQLVGGAGASRRAGADARQPPRPERGSARRRGRLGRDERRAWSRAAAGRAPGPRRRVRQQRPDGAWRAPRCTPDRAAGSPRPVGRRCRQHRRVVPFLAVADDRPSAGFGMPGRWPSRRSIGRSASPASAARRTTGPRGSSFFSRSSSSATAVGPCPRMSSGADPAAGNRLASKVVGARGRLATAGA